MIRVAFIIGDYPPDERRLREETAKSFSSAGVEVGIVSVAPSPFGGLGPAEIQLVAPYFHAAYLQAEREGYDAAVPLGTLDLGVDAGRSLIEDDGADVIIAHGITQCPVHMKPDWLAQELGVPVVEGIGAPIRMAATLAGLGLKHSRKRWPKSSARPNV